MFRLIPDQKPSLAPKGQMGGEYKVSLESVSELGTFISNGVATVAQLPDGRYEIKAILTPENPPFYGIQKPYYVRATFVTKIDSSDYSIGCKGGAYVVKGFFTKIVMGEDVVLQFSKPLSSENNSYSFSVEPFRLWGFSPGKMQNKGNITRVSSIISNEVRQKVSCKFLEDIIINEKPGLFRRKSSHDLQHESLNADIGLARKPSLIRKESSELLRRLSSG